MGRLRCAVCRKHSQQCKDLFFYKIPYTQKEKLELWENSMQRKFKSGTDVHICIAHFTPQQFVPLIRKLTSTCYKPLLLNSAIPSILKPTNYETLHIPLETNEHVVRKMEKQILGKNVTKMSNVEYKDLEKPVSARTLRVFNNMTESPAPDPLADISTNNSDCITTSLVPKSESSTTDEGNHNCTDHKIRNSFISQKGQDEELLMVEAGQICELLTDCKTCKKHNEIVRSAKDNYMTFCCTCPDGHYFEWSCPFLKS